MRVGRKPTREGRPFATTTQGLVALLAWLTESRVTHVAMEATGVYWKPVWTILSDGRLVLMVANAAHIKNMPGRKSAMNDAMWIADRLACGLIGASFVPEDDIQERRALMRPASNWCASRRGMFSASRRRLKRPTSSAVR